MFDFQGTFIELNHRRCKQTPTPMHVLVRVESRRVNNVPLAGNFEKLRSYLPRENSWEKRSGAEYSSSVSPALRMSFTWLSLFQTLLALTALGKLRTV
jgi:hypothetical protein